MILVDANLLIYAYDAGSPKHDAARSWLERMFSNGAPIGLPWIVILAFLRITTNPRAFERPLSMTEATAHVSAWLDQPGVRVLEPSPRHWKILVELLKVGQVKAALVMDAHLAALAIEHGATLATNDRDFRRFEGLRLEFPLAE